MSERVIEEVRLGRKLLVRLVPGDEVFASLEGILEGEGIQRAVIVSAIGSFERVAFRDLLTGADRPVELSKTNELQPQGPFEVLSLEGNLAPLDGKPTLHLHAMLGTRDGAVIGGHLITANVFTTAEIVMASLEGTAVTRVKNEVTGLNELTPPGV